MTNPDTVDWTMQDTALDRLHSATKGTFRRLRQALGKPPSPRQWGHPTSPALRAKWQSWDWALQNSRLGEIHGLSRERVRQIRVLLGKPRSPLHRQHTKVRTIADVERERAA